MEQFFEIQQRLLHFTTLDFVRSIAGKIDWNSRLVGIKGARGSGKTTLLLQYIKRTYASEPGAALYASLDNLWFADHSLYELAGDFVRTGGKHLFLDEVHRYPGWSREIKNIYDDFPQLRVVFTGSSLLEIINAQADLSRRAVIYHLRGLSFREFLALETGIAFDIFSLDDILHRHTDLAGQITRKIQPFRYFDNYLRYGYYPFYREQPDLYPVRLNQSLNMILEVELPQLRNLEVAYILKIKQLLTVLAESVPFTPDISKLSRKIGINRITLIKYLHYLEQSDLLILLQRSTSGVGRLQKPDKVYLENTNLMWALAPGHADKGHLRKTFFVNQLRNEGIRLAARGDFVVRGKYTFEVGGKHKSGKQVAGLEDAFIAADDLETGFGPKIPLWLFGFLY